MPESTSKARDKMGRWKPGASGNPTGRPVSNPARQLLLEKSEELVGKAIERALEGDVAALNVCLSRILPQYRPQQAPVMLDVPVDGDLVEIGRKIINATTEGSCPPDVAAQLLQGLGTLARVEELAELKERLAALELALKPKRGLEK
ncbi:hypothetical protein [Desulfurivibrio sp. C05AmB]|uniref:hypothetical protein n=1 Tax=Desulfurivibrio sp. C05AmB TaxID=3374371 RepID=UPI00376EC4A5